MQILRLLAKRRAASALTSPASERRDSTSDDDQGPFFDLDFSSCSVRASSSSGSSGSDTDSNESCAELDFIISLQRSSSASPIKFCASEPPTRASSLQSQQHGARKRGLGSLRTMSFGARKAAPLYGAGRHSFARSSFSSTGSLRLSMDSPPRATEHDKHHATAQTCRRTPSRDIIRRCLAKISRRLRTAPPSPRAESRGLRRLRKCRSASSAAPTTSSVTRRDDSAAEKQDGIAGAIAHCKESLHRASTSPLLRSRSDPGKEM